MGRLPGIFGIEGVVVSLRRFGGGGGRGQRVFVGAQKRSTTIQILVLDDAVMRGACNLHLHVFGNGGEEVVVGDSGDGQGGGVRPDLIVVGGVITANSAYVSPKGVPFRGLVGVTALPLLAMLPEMLFEAREQQHGEADQDAHD